MKTFKEYALKIISNRKIMGIALITIGLIVVLVFGFRSIRSFRQLQYIQEQGLDRGAAGVEAIRPWMTLKYVSVAYGVPVEYISAALGLPYGRRNGNATLGHLNQEQRLGRSNQGDYPAIVDKVATAVLEYQANPVTTGLPDIRPWMTLRYISNSTGVPEAYLLKQIGIGNKDNNVFKTLDELADLVRYEGGPHKLGDDLKSALEQYEARQ